METFAPSSVQLASDGDYCVWQAEGQPFEVYFRREAMVRLNNEVLEGYGALPKRGAEVGGLLLGQIERETRLIVIDDIRPVPCEHITGPSYVLSAADREHWTAVRQSGTHVVGCYRSDTRPGADHTVLQPQDIAFMQEFFAQESVAAFLVVRPLSVFEKVATFAFFEQGVAIGPLAKAEPFPFQGPAAAFRAPVTPAAPVKRRIPGFVWPVSALAASLICAVLLRDHQYEEPVPVSASASIGLKAEHVGDELHFTWDRGADPVRNATAGTIAVTDGEARKTGSLDASQVQSGSLKYSPDSGNVNFELQVKPPDGAPVQESVRTIAPHSIKKRSPAADVLRNAPVDVQVDVDSSGRIVDSPRAKAGGVRHFFARVGTKAVHLWPFRSDKHQQNP